MSEDEQKLWDRFKELSEKLYVDVEDGDLKGLIYSFRYALAAHKGEVESAEIKNDMKELLGLIPQLVGDHDPFTVLREIEANRLYQENTDTIFKSFGSPVLNATNIDDGIEKYKKCTAYVFNCWRKALREFKQEDYPLAIFLSILALEEAAKFHQAWYELFYNDGKPLKGATGQHPRKKDYKFNHRKKHFVSIISGAMLNHRIERLFGKDRVVKFIKMVDDGGLENVRQSCLYATLGVDGPVYPDEAVSKEDALFYVLFFGEAIGEFIFMTRWEYHDFKEEMDKEIEELGLPPVA